MIETLTDDDGTTLAWLVRAGFEPDQTTFVTPAESTLQLGFVVYGAGSEVPRHAHRVFERRIVGTAEVLVVRRGRCTLELYDDDRRHVADRELVEGDVLLLVAGGHRFRIDEPTVLLEVKQGPYGGLDEKERF